MHVAWSCTPALMLSCVAAKPECTSKYQKSSVKRQNGVNGYRSFLRVTQQSGKQSRKGTWDLSLPHWRSRLLLAESENACISADDYWLPLCLCSCYFYWDYVSNSESCHCSWALWQWSEGSLYLPPCRHIYVQGYVNWITQELKGSLKGTQETFKLKNAKLL